MGVWRDNSKYPVIDRSPSIWRTVNNFGLRDYGYIASFWAFAAPVGYFSGVKVHLPKQSTVMASTIGLLAGYLYAYQASAGRLMGVFPNDKEVEASLARRQD